MNLIDRYIVRQFLSTLIFSLVALCVIFLVVNLLENLDEFLDQHAKFITIVKYYIYFFPEILKILTPVAMLLSTLFTVGRMSNLNEIIAMKSGGLSLYRLMIPFMILGVLISGGQLYFNGWLVPKANHEKMAIEKIYFHQSKEGGPIYNLYFRDNPLRNVVMQYYDADNKVGTNISVEDYSSLVEPRLIKRVEARQISWDSVKKAWRLSSGIERDYSGTNVLTTTFSQMEIALRTTHNQIVQIQRSPDEMNFDERRNYIDILSRGGKDVRQQLIEYYGDYSFPLANFIVILFGVPFASVRKKGGIAIQIGASMVVSFLYLIFTKLGQTIGYSSDFNPIVSAWLANIVFFVAGLIIIMRTKT